jgi:hypothetical protein
VLIDAPSFNLNRFSRADKYPRGNSRQPAHSVSRIQFES